MFLCFFQIVYLAYNSENFLFMNEARSFSKVEEVDCRFEYRSITKFGKNQIWVAQERMLALFSCLKQKWTHFLIIGCFEICNSRCSDFDEPAASGVEDADNGQMLNVKRERRTEENQNGNGDKEADSGRGSPNDDFHRENYYFRANSIRLL